MLLILLLFLQEASRITSVEYDVQLWDQLGVVRVGLFAAAHSIQYLNFLFRMLSEEVVLKYHDVVIAYPCSLLN